MLTDRESTYAPRDVDARGGKGEEAARVVRLEEDRLGLGGPLRGEVQELVQAQEAHAPGLWE